jgi:uncharacterized protein
MVNSADIFGCKLCGKCCIGFGGTYLTEDDIQNIARHIGSDPDTFISQYCQKSGNHPVLAQGDNGYCVFWDGSCTIHEVKPRMCKAWPFIKPVLADVKNWHIMANSCPGMRIDVQDREILRCVEKELNHHREG